MTVFVVDIGGTNVQTGIWARKTLTQVQTTPTMATYEAFESYIEQRLNEIQKNETLPIEGIGISSPGLVDEANQVIKEPSAVPFIHQHNLWHKLEAKFQCPVTILNDANASGICEMNQGVGAKAKSAIFIVIGTGVGGAVFINRQLVLGHHLSAGEFGMMGAYYGKNLSQRGTVANMAKKYQEQTGQTIDGKALFDQSQQGDSLAKALIESMYQNLSKALFDLQMILDPQMVIISGGISERSEFIQELNERLFQLLKQEGMAHVMPVVTGATFKNQSNLIGAGLHFEKIKEGL